MEVKENKSANKERDMDKSSVVYSSGDGPVVASQEQIEEGYVDLGEMHPNYFNYKTMFVTGAIR